MASMFQLASRRATAAAAPAARLAPVRASVRGVTVLPPTFSLTAAARAALSTAQPAAASAAMAAALTSTTATLQRHVVGGTGAGADALAAAADGSRALARGSASHAAAGASHEAGATEMTLVSDEEAGSGSEAGEGVTTPTSNLSGGTPVNEVAGISDALKSRLLTAGIASLFPVQQETLTRVLAGEDVVVRSRTGSGKTLGFAIPVVELLSREPSSKAPRCLVLAPTRELAKQIETEFQRIAGSLRTTSIYGSMSYTLQISALRRGVDVVVGTPGRIIDLLNSKHLDLSECRVAVLDEADEMLRMGFKEDCEQIFAAMPPATERQTMLWSATVPPWVRQLTSTYCRSAKFVDLVGNDAPKLAATASFQACTVTPSTRGDIFAAFLSHAVASSKSSRVLVFTDTKKEASELSRLSIPGVNMRELTGDLSQPLRDKALADFRAGRVNVLCATDVAARGLDIPDVDLVVHYRMPQQQETFVHRSGRTARAGRDGRVVALMEPSDWSVATTWERSLQFSFSVVATPSIDAAAVLTESAARVAAQVKSVPASVTAAVQRAGVLQRLLGADAAAAVADSPLLTPLANALALVALGADGGIAAGGMQSSLITGSKGFVTTCVRLDAPVLSKFVGPLDAALLEPSGALNSRAAASALSALLNLAGVSALDRPRRMFVLPPNEQQASVVFDAPAVAFEAVTSALAKAAVKSGMSVEDAEAAVRRVDVLPASVKTVLVEGQRGGGGGSSYGGGGGGGGGDFRRRERFGGDRFGGDRRRSGGGGGDRFERGDRFSSGDRFERRGERGDRAERGDRFERGDRGSERRDFRFEDERRGERSGDRRREGGGGGGGARFGDRRR